MDNIDLNEKIKAGLLGFAVGDALGVPVEFRERESLEASPITDMREFGTHQKPKGTWSDDTSMTLATMDSIAKMGKVDFDDMMKRFVNWYNNAEYTATDEVFDIGSSTTKALSNYVNRIPPIECGGTDIKENGNGSLMRMLPFAFYISVQEFDEETKRQLIDEASSLTHAHNISKLGCQLYVDYIIELLRGENKLDAYQKMLYGNYFSYGGDTLAVYKKTMFGKLPTLERDNIASTGYVADTFEASLWCTLTSSSFEEAVLKAVNLGGDTDTIGAITGSINGLIYGLESIPKPWLDALAKRELLEKTAEDFAKGITPKREKSL